MKARRLRREGLGQGDAHQDAEEEGDDDDVDVDVDVKTVDEGEKEKKAEVVDLPSSVMSREQGGADLPSSAVVSEQGDANLPSSPGRKSQEVGFDDLTFCGEETVVIFDQSQPNLGKLLSPCSPPSPRLADRLPRSPTLPYPNHLSRQDDGQQPGQQPGQHHCQPGRAGGGRADGLREQKRQRDQAQVPAEGRRPNPSPGSDLGQHHSGEGAPGRDHFPEPLRRYGRSLS